MADYIISPYAISFNTIKKSLESYVKNKSNVLTTWKDFYTSSVGETIIELDAGVATFYAFHCIIGRREAYLTTAQNYSSVVGGALGLGYNSSRGHNLIIDIDVIPETTGTFQNWTVMGSYADYDLVLMMDDGEVVFNTGEKTTIRCVIGNSQAQSLKMTSEELSQFTFTTPNSTDHARLILNDTILDTTENINESVDDKWVMLTNAYGAVDVFYAQNGNQKYTVNDTLYFNYIESNKVTASSFNKTSLSVNYVSQVDEVTTVSDKQSVEDKEHIRAAAPIKHELNGVVRARKDYKKYLLQANKTLIDTNDLDITPGLIGVCAVKNPQESTELLTDEEKQQFMESVTKMSPSGVTKCLIYDSVKLNRTLNIKIWKLPKTNLSTTLDEDVQEILDKYSYILEADLDLGQIEHDIEQLNGVKKARIDFGESQYASGTIYQPYDIVTVSDVFVDNQYEDWNVYCYDIKHRQGTEEPDWANAKSQGDTIVDNNLVWENTNVFSGQIANTWNTSADYKLQDDIHVTYGIPGSSSSGTEPQWNDNASNITNGNISMKLVKKYESTSSWDINKKFVKDNCICVQSGNDRCIYKAQTIHNYSGYEEPQWTNETTEDNALTWQFKYNKYKTNTEYNYLDTIAIDVDGSLYIYTCTNLTGGKSGPECMLNGQAVYEETWQVPVEPFDEEDPQYETITGPTWTLQNQFEPITIEQWTERTEIPVGTYVLGNDMYHVCESNDNTITSDYEIAWMDGYNWLYEIVDNNIIWVKDTYTLNDIQYNCEGSIWQPFTTYSKGQILIQQTDSYTYVYLIYSVNPNSKNISNQVFEVVNYCSTTGSQQPTWDTNTVLDNDILWTRYNEITSNNWSPNMSVRIGHLINVMDSQQQYHTYRATCLCGTSGYITPDWEGNINGLVEDNNIVWLRLQDNTKLSLKWNEYFVLKVGTISII